MLNSSSVKWESSRARGAVCAEVSRDSPGANVAAPLLTPALSVVASPSVMFAESDICQCCVVAVDGKGVQSEISAQGENLKPYSSRSGTEMGSPPLMEMTEMVPSL